ncbi:MAG: S26 family signal peptidase [Thermoplasmata archaeon]
MSSRRDSDDPSSNGGDLEETEERTTSSRRASRRPPPHPSKNRGPVRRWSSSRDTDEEDDDDLEPAPGRRGILHREPRPVYWRARDSLYFEPLVAVAIIVVMLVGLYAYTQNWPPVYVVESDSMQHGSTDILGVINTGDLVLAQRLPTNQITTYVAGLQTGYSTYGEYGDVILYSANGQGSTPIIHRAIIFLQWDPATSSYNATGLAGLQSAGRCGNASGAVYATPGTLNDCGTTDLTGALDLIHVGWNSVNVSIDLSSPSLGRHSGFLTMGDNNFEPTGCSSNCEGLPDQQTGLSELVEPGWIVGVARGMLPWFGAIKLVLEGNAGSVPPQSWQFLGLTVVGLILLAFGIHYALRAEGIEDERRKEEEDAEAEAADELHASSESGGGRGRRFLRALRPWNRSDTDSEDEEDDIRPPRRSAPKTPSRLSPHRGRPPPKVKRSEKSKRKHRSEKDEDL